jgi:hypothetical protein
MIVPSDVIQRREVEDTGGGTIQRGWGRRSRDIRENEGEEFDSDQQHMRKIGPQEVLRGKYRCKTGDGTPKNMLTEAAEIKADGCRRCKLRVSGYPPG